MDYGRKAAQSSNTKLHFNITSLTPGDEEGTRKGFEKPETKNISMI